MNLFQKVSVKHVKRSCESYFGGFTFLVGVYILNDHSEFSSTMEATWKCNVDVISGWRKLLKRSSLCCIGLWKWSNHIFRRAHKDVGMLKTKLVQLQNRRLFEDDYDASGEIKKQI